MLRSFRGDLQAGKVAGILADSVQTVSERRAGRCLEPAVENDMVQGVGKILYSKGIPPQRIIKDQLPRSVAVGYVMEALSNDIEKAVSAIATFLEKRVRFTTKEIRFFADKMIEGGKADKAGWLLGHHNADIHEVIDRARELFDDNPSQAGRLLMGYGRVDDIDPKDVVDFAYGFIRDGASQYAAWLLNQYRRISEIGPKHAISLAIGLLERGFEHEAVQLLEREDILVSMDPDIVVTICQKLDRVDILDKYISTAKLSKADMKALRYLRKMLK